MNEQTKQNSETKQPPSNATEAGYLTNQANEAAAAIGQAFAALKQDLVKGVDPSTLAKQYPWAAVGAAAVAGFMAASTVVPSKEQQALKKLERIERALRPVPMAHEYAVPPGAPGASQNKSIMGRLASELFSALKPALSSALAAYAAAPSEEDNGKQQNGKGGHTSSAAAAGSAVYFQQEEEQRRQQQAP